MVKYIKSEAEYNDIIVNKKTFAIVDFYADWCGPCRAIAPAFQSLSDEYKDKLEFYKVDVASKEVEEVSSKHEVRSIPTFIIFKNGEAVDTLSGANKAALENLIKKHC